METLKDIAQGSGEADEAATGDPRLFRRVGSRISGSGETKPVPKKNVLEIDDPPKLPPLKLRSTDRCINCLASNLSLNFLSGARGLNGRPSVSEGIVDNRPDLGSAYVRAGEGELELPLEFGDECGDDCRDADAYDNDDDPGYHRHPIEDEEWFLEHEIEYPSDDDLARSSQEGNSVHASEGQREGDDDGSLVGDSYFSGEEFYHKGDSYGVLGGQPYDSSTQDWHQESDAEELALVSMPGAERPQEVVNGVHSTSEVENGRSFPASASVSICGEAVPPEKNLKDEGSKESSLMKGRGGRGPPANGKTVTQNSTVAEPDTVAHYDDEENGVARLDNWAFERQEDHNFFSSQINVRNLGEAQVNTMEYASGVDGFSFPSPSVTGGLTNLSDPESPWLATVPSAEANDSPDLGYSTGGPDDTLAAWRRRSSEVYPFPDFENSSVSGLPLPLQISFDGQDYGQIEDQGGEAEVDEEEEGSPGDEAADDRVAKMVVRNAGHQLVVVSQNTQPKSEVDEVQGKNNAESAVSDDDDVAAVQGQVSKPRPEEDEFETFYLKIVHRKNRTGFEEDKDFPVVINSVIAGRYHVTEYLGSAAFSKAIQAHDLHTGMDVCMKIIKNNKDFFDQSLDEIKLLKFINKHDPGDNHHVLRLYDYFYHCEHLFIVCELLRANLYEFQKYNRESGGEVYFTMPRLQLITRQCLDALEFIHKLGLIHCDLKPENILVKSYSRCEVKVIDLGSSCFQTDHLCSYVQSRSYRAPEVILGLPYSEKIDIWSLGCILAELCSGNVLFQNESLATLLARIIGILGPIQPEMLSRGRDSHKYFTRHYTLYERNQETDQLEYIVPKKTSLAHRLPMGDEGFIDFVGFLLEVDPHKRPSASEARKHPWLSYEYEPTAGGYLATED